MGLVKIITTGSTHIAIWNFGESKHDATINNGNNSCSPSASSHRELKRLAVKNILSTLNYHEDVSYHPNGRPIFINTPMNISISHAGCFVVVALSEKKDFIGVDIEQTKRKFKKIASKYLSAVELGWIDSDCNKSMALSWCIKESILKLPWSIPKDIIHDIDIEPFINPYDMGNLDVNVNNGDDKINVRIEYQFFEGYCLAWACV